MSPQPALDLAPERPPLTPALGNAERKYILAVAMKYMKDEEAAADVAQDALLLAHRHRDSFRGDSRYSTWLYRIAATTALMHLRKRRRSRCEVLAPAESPDVDPIFLDRPDPSAGPEDQAVTAEAVALASQTLAALGHKYERIFWLRYGHGFTETEIAAQLELSLATVKTRAHRARVAVRETLRDAA